MAQTAAAGALFLYTEWSKDKCGLTGFHRRVIKEFCARKAKVGQSIKAYTTVLSLKLTDDQMTDAASCGVTLIPAQIQKFSDPEDEVPELKWLTYYNIHYPDINVLENIQYVVGYAPKTGAAAAIIRDKVFPEAQLVLINHVCPGEQSLLGNDNEEQKLSKMMLKLASEADILFSIGPKIYQYFDNEYRVKFPHKIKQLSDIPHVEILPKPESVFFDINQTIIPGDTRCNILTYGEYDTPEGLDKCDVMAKSIGKAANIRKENRCSAPDWKIQGIAPNPKREDRKKLVEKMESSHVQPKFYPDCSVGALMTTLQQSHLCLPPPYHKDYSLQGLEAIAAGLPTRAEDGSQLAWLLKEYYEDHADYIICDSQQRPYHGEILETMRNVMVEFKKANKLKIALQAHEDIFLGSAKLTSLLTDRALQQQTIMNSRVNGVGEKQNSTSKPNLGKDETLKMQQQPQAIKSEASEIYTPQGAQKVESISTHITPGKAENPTKVERSQQEGTNLETENTSHIRHQTKTQHTSSEKGGTDTEAKKRKEEVGEQPIKMDDTSVPPQDRIGLIQYNIKAKQSENTETTELQRTRASQSEVTLIDAAQGTQKALSQPVTFAMTGTNPQKTITLPEMVEPGKCEETQAGEKSTGVENPGEMKSQMVIGGLLGAEKSTGPGEEQGSNELELIIEVNEEPFMQKGEEEAETASTECQNKVKQRVEEVLGNEGDCHKIVDTVKENLGDVEAYGLTVGSLGILLRLPGLYNLYRLKQTCKSTNLAKAFEPLLITDEMTQISSKVGVTLQLKATYNKASFKEVELFFINRDGGGVKPVEVYTHFERKNIEEIRFDADSEDADATKTKEKATLFIQHPPQTEVDMTDLEEQITESGKPILSRIDVTSSVSSQAKSLLLYDFSPKQHKKYDISYYLDLAQVEVPSLALKVSKLEQMLVASLIEKSKFEKGSTEIKKRLEEKIVTLQTEKEILENQLAEACQQRLVLENQNRKNTLALQSAESVAAKQLTDINSLKNELENLKPKNIEKEIRALEDRIKDKDKTIDDFKHKLSKLHVSDVKQDAELQEKIAEILGEDYPSMEPEKGVSSDQTESGVEASGNTLQPIQTKESPSDLFTKTLFDLAQEITHAKLKDLKFLCEGILTAREIASLRNPDHLFNMLRDKNLISESNTALLKDMLCTVGLNPLVEKYFKPSTYQGVSSDQMESGVEPIPTNERLSYLFNKRLFDLAQEITDAKLEELKFLCKYKLPARRELDSLRHPYDLFNMLRNKGHITKSDTTLLEEMLYRIGLNPLVRKYLKSSLYQGLLQNKMTILQSFLKNEYKHHYSFLQPIPWYDDLKLKLCEIFTTLEVKQVKGETPKMDTALENLHDMFKSSDTRRIRIEGAPGMGKSTLCRKLAYDWSCGELQQYTLLFFLEMRDIAKTNMIDEIFDQLILDDFDLSKQELSEIVSRNIESVLFLCDGLDEPDEYQVASSEIPKLISEELYPWCTVVITTRPQLCNKYLSRCDSYYIVQGFTPKHIDEYILKYFKNDTDIGNSLIQQIKDQKETQKLMTGLLRNPLHISFLCILWEDCKFMGDHFPETLTALYSEILECTLKKYCVKNNIQLENGEIPKSVLHDRDSLAADSYKAYRSNKINFDRSEISSEATLNFGLLVKDLSHTLRKSEQIYFFYDMTWLEYFTALHVTSQLKSKDTTILEEFLENPHKHSQILKFIAGIVQRQESDVFFMELNKKLQNIISSL